MPSNFEPSVRRQRRGRGGLVVGGVGILLIAASAIRNALASEGVGENAWSPAMLTFGIVGCIVGALIYWMDATEKRT